jgi:hypothetical protein
VFRRYQVDVAGSYTPMPLSPVPAQSPVTGVNDPNPNTNGAMSGGPADGVLRKNHVPVESNSPIPEWPVPVQSPMTGFQPGLPYVNGAMSGAPAEVVVRKYQFAVFGSNSPIPGLLVPVQPPRTGSQELKP